MTHEQVKSVAAVLAHLQSVPESRLFDARDAVLAAFPFIGTLSSGIASKTKTSQEERVERIIMRQQNRDTIAAEASYDNEADDPERWSVMLRAAVYSELQDGYASQRLKQRRAVAK